MDDVSPQLPAMREATFSQEWRQPRERHAEPVVMIRRLILLRSNERKLPIRKRHHLSPAGRGRRKRAAFSERLHVVQRTRKLGGPLLNVLFPSGVVGQHRVVEDQCVNEL